MAPEQVRGFPADHRCDIFSFGVVLHEMLSGRAAFKRDTAADTMTAILKEDPLEGGAAGRPFAPGIERILRHCLEKSPEERFQSSRDLAFNLEAVSGTSDSLSAPAVAPGLRKRGLATTARVLALLVAAALGVLAGRTLWETHILSRALEEPNLRSILELRGLGKATWDGMSPERHVETERQAWD